MDPAPSVLQSGSIPGYQILREVHRGGQGVVYQAIQKATKRRVAVKVMREGPFAGPLDKARFEREVHVLAALQHPGIVAVHDSGTASGNFFYVMDYISGQPLGAYVQEHSLTIEDSLRLFIEICEAVNAAHLRGIIHRDLKPDNIRIDTEGTPHILDFGLAKLALGQVTNDSEPQMMTMTGQFVGSAPWASPEQAEGVPDKIDIRTDVYSLGVVLYQMLTGEFPYDMTGSIWDVLVRVRQAEPVRPSTIRRQINDEVETIMLKCLAKERERRYQSAGELARDIKRYLAGEPIEAKRDSTIYVLRKTLRRHRLPVAVTAGFVLLLLLSSITAITLWYRAERGRKAAEESHQLADAKTLEAEVARGQAEEREQLAQRRLYTRQIALAEHAMNTDSGPLRKLLRECPAELRGWEWYWLWKISDSSRRTLRGHTEDVISAAFTPEGNKIVSTGLDGTLRTWDTGTSQVLQVLESKGEGLAHLALDPSGLRAVVGGDGVLECWDLVLERKLWAASDGEVRYAVAFSPDGKTVADSGFGAVVTLRDAANGNVQAQLRGHEGCINGLAFTPDGQYLASGSWDWTIRLWETASRIETMVLCGHEAAVYCLAISPDGRYLLSGSHDNTLRLWDLETGSEIRVFRGHHMAVNRVAFSTDGQRVCSTSRDGTVRVWNPEDARQLSIFRGHESSVQGVAFSLDSKYIVSGSRDHALKIWEVDEIPGERVLVSGDAWFGKIAFSPDAKLLVAAGETRTLFWDVEEDREYAPAPELRLAATDAVFSPDGDFILLKQGASLALYEFPGGRKVWEVPVPLHNMSDIAKTSPDGRLVAYCPEDLVVRIRDTGTGAQQLELRGHSQVITSLDFSPDSKHIATGAMDTVVKIWDTATGHEVCTCRGHTQVVNTVVFSPDGALVASASSDHTVRLWNAETGQEVRPPLQHPTFVNGLAFSQDGRQLISGEAVMRIWDLQSGDLLLSFGGDPGFLYGTIALSPDGRHLAAGGKGHWAGVVIWEAATPQEVTAASLPEGPLKDFDADHIEMRRE